VFQKLFILKIFLSMSSNTVMGRSRGFILSAQSDLKTKSVSWVKQWRSTCAIIGRSDL